MNFARQYGVAPSTFVGPGHGSRRVHPSGLCGTPARTQLGDHRPDWSDG